MTAKLEAAGVIFHSNDNYTVQGNEDSTEYNVVNSFSGIVEFNAPSLPECIFAAENLNVVLVHRTYEWVGKRAQEQAAKEAGIVDRVPPGVTRIN